MSDILKKALGRGPEDRDGMTVIEMLVVVGSIAVFASIYAYIVVSAITSNPLSISP